MKISNSTKKTEETEKAPKYGCDFCGRSFLRESTIAKHICEYKQRWMNKDLVGNRIGFQAWVEFYKKNTNSKKTKTTLQNPSSLSSVLVSAAEVVATLPIDSQGGQKSPS